jgi:meso-butanediol dehydrogenase/(S,S)-butanediol dehydrogenase/diacetyl reductase
MRNLANRAVMVTGGASGLGKAIVERFLEEGALVLATDRDADALAELPARPNFETLSCDVTDAAAVRAAVARAVALFGKLDVVVNNAGIGPVRTPLHEAGIDEWHQVIEVNLTGVFYGMKFGIEQMLGQDSHGTIVNIASIGGMIGVPQMPSYVAAKGGLINLTRSAAIEYGPVGIRVNAVAPAAVVTPLLRRMAGSAADDIIQANPLAGAVTPEDVAAAVAFLASDDARSISGVILPVDGGYTAQ